MGSTISSSGASNLVVQKPSHTRNFIIAIMCLLVLAWASVIMILVAVDETMTDVMVRNFRIFSGVMLAVYAGFFGWAGWVLYDYDKFLKAPATTKIPSSSASAGPANQIVQEPEPPIAASAPILA